MSDILERFTTQVNNGPNLPAIIDHDHVTTYKQLESLARRVAYCLNSQKNPRALILLPQSTEAYASIIGTLMAGGYYCPVNTALPIHRKAQIIELFDPDFIITNASELGMVKSLIVDLENKKSPTISPNEIMEGYQDTFAPGKLEIVTVESLPQEPVSFLTSSSAHELAYVIFTSGSTGQPKGVMIRRYAVSQFINWAVQSVNPTPEDRWGQFSNLGFDLSVMDMYTTFAGGATLIPINTPKDRLMPATAIQKYKLTIWHSVPSVIDLMSQAKHIIPEMLSSLRLMSFCGEPLRPQHLSELFQANKKMTVFNTYGPTEGTVFCTWIPLQMDNYLEACRVSVAIGNPIPGWDIHLLGDENPNEGEIVISGNFLGAGYWRNPSITRTSYLEIKTDDQTHCAYYTGDWAERHGKHIFFSHRIDRQVKIHGYRVELGEIDFYIREFGIINSYSLLHQGKIYTFLEAKESINQVELRRFLANHLPSYAIPSRFICKSSLPRNYNDKIDTKFLHSSLNEELF